MHRKQRTWAWRKSALCVILRIELLAISRVGRLMNIHEPHISTHAAQYNYCKRAGRAGGHYVGDDELITSHKPFTCLRLALCVGRHTHSLAWGMIMLAVFDICLMDVDGLSVAIIIAAAVPLWTHRTAAGRRNNCVIDASQLKPDARMCSHTACIIVECFPNCKSRSCFVFQPVKPGMHKAPCDSVLPFIYLWLYCKKVKCQCC